MKVSIIIPSFRRAHLLQWNLISLSKQIIPFEFETLLLNDGLPDETESLCNAFKEQLHLKYIFTGKRNSPDKMIWRVPGFVLNIGVKQASGDIIIICCAEMFHLNNTIELLSNAVDNKVIAIPKAKDDNGLFLKHLQITKGNYNINEYEQQPILENVKFPFLIAMKWDEFVSVGGYDEDFTGTDYDDTDFVGRLVKNGCVYKETEAQTIHLWHPRLSMTAERIPRFQHNKKLYEDRQGIVLRNVGREWGAL
jgi:glycosyltransferase involved in cell wall biosynthesis